MIVQFFSSGFIDCVYVCIECLLSFSWGDVPDGVEQSAIVEPVEPFEGFPFNGIG